MNPNPYFSECQTLDAAKTLWKKLCRENHPDIGGDLRTMQNINAAYSDFLMHFAKSEARTRQTDAHANGKKSAADFHDMDEIGEALREMIDFAISLDGVEVELMGLWLWLTGNTKAHKETLKAWNETHTNKWKWSPKKTAWYFAAVPSFNRKETTLDEIRNAYGSTTYTRQSTPIAGSLSS